jgi:hypothetical protein
MTSAVAVADDATWLEPLAAGSDEPVPEQAASARTRQTHITRWFIAAPILR